MYRILIADDDPGVRNLLRSLLEMDGHEVFDACNGPLAVALGRLYLPDVFLCDLCMPEVDGLETIRAFREALPDVPIIAMSALVDLLPAASDLGAAGVLAKPFRVAAVVGRVRAVLEGSPLAVEGRCDPHC